MIARKALTVHVIKYRNQIILQPYVKTLPIVVVVVPVLHVNVMILTMAGAAAVALQQTRAQRQI